MMLNLGNDKFAEIGQGAGVDGVEDARGYVASDFDHDGDVDIIVNNYKSRANYYVNEVPNNHQWLAVTAQGTTSNRDAVGAEITAVVGDRRIMRLVGAGHAYTGQFSFEQLLGLKDATTVDQLEVRWPNGKIETFGAQKSNQRIVVIEGSGEAIAHASPVPTPGTADEKTTDPRMVALIIGILIALVLLSSRRARGRKG